MGNTQACNNLQKYNNVCDMYNCTREVEGLASRSASDSDTWILKFKNGTKYDGKNIEAGFLKLWISDTYISYAKSDGAVLWGRTEEEAKDIKSFKLMGSKSMNYETKVYKDVIRELVDTNVCPNFIKYLGSGRNCSFEDISRLIWNSQETKTYDGVIFNKDNADYALYRNFIYMLNNVSGRPSVNDRKAPLPDRSKIMLRTAKWDVINKEVRFNAIVNEVIKPDTKTVDDLSIKRELVLFDDKDEPIVESWKIVFQIIAGCYAMSSAKMCHNDLHLGNIYVENWTPSDGDYRVNYNYENKLYTFETNKRVKIFDFDRAHVVKFGDNPVLNTYCKYSQCNEFISNLDVIKVFGYLYRNIKGRRREIHKSKILRLCSESTKGRKILRETWDKGPFLSDPVSNNRLATKEYSNFNTVLKVLDNCASLAGISNDYPTGYTPSVDSTFICNSDMFDDNGILIDTKVSKCVSQEQQIKQLKTQNTQIMLENRNLRENMNLIEAATGTNILDLII